MNTERPVRSLLFCFTKIQRDKHVNRPAINCLTVLTPHWTIELSGAR